MMIMEDLKLDVRMDGYKNPIGVLSQNEEDLMLFSYTDEYKKKPLNMSLGMKQGGIFSDLSCRAFFGNLVHEREDIVSRILEREQIELNNVGGLLSHLGKDCAGAVTVQPQGTPPARIHPDFETDYERIEEADMVNLVRSLQNRDGLPDKFYDPSSIAGFQAKLAITVLPDGSFAQPIKNSGAPTTHILKISNAGRLNETVLEESVMNLSKKVGIETAKVINREIGDVNTLLVTRYDRQINEDGHVIRLHQEDFTQALGLLSEWKYERYHGEESYFNVKSVAGIINKSANPEKMREEFITSTVFDLMVGNNDNHAKNFSLFHKEDGTFEPTPRYDIVPARYFKEITDQLAYSIGNAKTIEEITADDFDMFLTDLGIENPSEQKRVRDKIVLDLGHKLANELDYIDKSLGDLIAGNIRCLFWEFDFEIPESTKSRLEYYKDQAGGWLI